MRQPFIFSPTLGPSKIICDLADRVQGKRKEQIKSVVFDALDYGVGIMTSNGEHIKRVDFFKQLPEIEQG